MPCVGIDIAQTDAPFGIKRVGGSTVTGRT